MSKKETPLDETSDVVQDEETETRETYDLLISPEATEIEEATDDKVAADLADERHFKTKYGDGHTYNPDQAAEQGLTYTPPTDPPVLPSSEATQGVEVAAGFSPSMEQSNPDTERLPSHVDNNDLDLIEDIYLILRNNSETGHLTDIQVQVNQGVVNLLGPVAAESDIGMVHDIVQNLKGVVAVDNNLHVRP